MPELIPFDVDILLIGGLQGAGKSSLATGAFGDRQRVNRDDIRSFHKTMTTGTGWRPEDWNDGIEPLITAIESNIIRFELGMGHRLVIDNTLINRRLRTPYIALAREQSRSIGCLFLDLPFQSCVERNRQRERQVPERVLADFHASIEFPTKEEGLDFVRILKQPVARTSGALELPGENGSPEQPPILDLNFHRGGLS